MQLSKYFTVETDDYLRCRTSSLGGNRKDGICTWLEEYAEADALVNVNNNANCAPFHPVSARAKRSDLLVRVQDEPDLPEGSIIEYNETKGTSKQLAVKRSILSHGHSDSSEDEYNPQALELAMSESKQRTIADQFHEALRAAPRNEGEHMYAVSGHTGVGLFGKLQRVMHREKEKDSYFLNKLPNEDHGTVTQLQFLFDSDEAGCFDVKIVCSCSSIDNEELPMQSLTNIDNPRNAVKAKQMTIIFSSRICSDVELDVRTLVRIHPWKEVNVKGKVESTV